MGLRPIDDLVIHARTSIPDNEIVTEASNSLGSSFGEDGSRSRVENFPRQGEIEIYALLPL